MRLVIPLNKNCIPRDSVSWAPEFPRISYGEFRPLARASTSNYICGSPQGLPHLTDLLSSHMSSLVMETAPLCVLAALK